ncbi:hypothetical protein KG522_002102 [Salmonella enterica subsp. diarizonae serovar 50:z52:z35]|nr:hypothetical protein [Salmonella enterica subsp. diarizonae]EHN1753108.1 hypothetical protein [Salmonella enterica subsp. diarizonae serovar 50:z52:z35]
MMMNKILLAVSVAFAGSIFHANGASFDCKKAKSFSEKTICSDSKLSKDDDDLKYLYGRAKASVQDRQAFSEITKTLWNSRERCSDFTCVNSWYDTAFAIYGAIAEKGIPETNGKNDILANAEQYKSETTNKNVSPIAGDKENITVKEGKIQNLNDGYVKVVNPKITYQLKNESAFVDVIEKAIIKSKSAKNDMQIGGIKALRDKEICNILQVKSVSNWIGQVKKVSANSDGKGVLALSLPSGILIKTWNNSFSDTKYNTLMEPGTEIFNRASELSVGDVVYFSGTFFEDNDNCISESSLSLSGKVKEPEFIFRFSDIRKYQQ